mmetsp:Transcript_9283/g.12768  ORF Transcript_9283/g.12768 Transcript_9283/m.12768 type:complete len:198 (-) Transcript_9283:192-785(-)
MKPKTGDGKQHRGTDEGELPSVVFRRCLGSEDWNYPWNLCGGIYRGTDVMTVLENLSGCTLKGRNKGEANKHSFDHPNHLEVNGNKAVVELGIDSKRPFSACPAKAVASVVTINRVQDVYKNRIYSTKTTHKTQEEGVVRVVESAGSDSNVDPGSTESLDSLLWKGFTFDLEAYKEIDPAPKSVHIGLLKVSMKQRD